MLFTDIIGNFDESAFSKIDDILLLDEFNLNKKNFKALCISGKEIEISLQSSLKNHDIISNKEKNILVKFPLQELLLIFPKDISEAAKVGHFLALKKYFLHIDNNLLITQNDNLIKEWLNFHNIKNEVSKRTLDKAFKDNV
ncbi:hypothetical protein [Campylobacter canadensis]|uniref:Uncharacterized protein n=1 Tax=Campylobacter canadensis TaxID=449520 RepID=A0ABS7WTS2_9BACT|nr:hypothetical protein [Campylobacter canadensis]MBZ7987702.1 hypothetical protein [Campylobacter canadensis]MBZ7994109.1 hypothetical protein [Campylobacter canadensis]MBZ7995888.1 hypothetical protein [Campylobacter canadensis]MBZ7997525.1 hypothetical protein [Campylobacter canadensis]MBZ7999440.1 hypothetical protein [Campylobacter canadensis]